MEFIAPIPFDEAIQKLGDQSVIGSTFTSSEWGDLPLQLRDNAFFSSRIESARVLQRAQDLLGNFLAGNRTKTEAGETMLATGSRAAFVSQMQDFLAQEGIVRGAGGLTDIASEQRLGLIFDVKSRQAQDFGWWKQGMDPDVLNEFPAMRFIRVRDVKEPRELHQQYENQVYLKNDPIWWLVINHDFGTPWGPWGWGCGHDVEDVDRDEAEQLHLLKPGETIQAPKKFLNLNTDLQASIKTLAPDLVEKLKKEFGNKVKFDEKNQTLSWNTVAEDKELEASLSPQRQSPVSDAIQLKVHGDLADQARAALAAIDKVHDDGNLPEIPLWQTSRRWLGYFQPQYGPDGLTGKYIAIRPDGSWPALTAVHETGHFLDLDAIGAKGGFATTDNHPLMRAVLDAAEKTSAITKLRAHYATYGDETSAYFLKPQEIWARAYAQFVAERSGSPLLQQQLASAQSTGDRQWSAADFSPLANAIEKLFIELGWL